MIHPKLRQLQQLQERQRRQYRRQQPSRAAAATAAMAGVYASSYKLLLGGLAVGLLSLLLTFAGLRVARLCGFGQPAGPEARGSLTMPANGSRLGAVAGIGPRQPVRRPPDEFPALDAPAVEGMDGAASNWTSRGSRADGAKFLGRNQIRNGSAVRTRRPAPLPGSSDRSKPFVNETLLRRSTRALREYYLFVNDKGGYDNNYYWKFRFCEDTDQCFGYQKCDVATVTPDRVLQQCTFSRNYQYEVPMMLKKVYSLKRLNNYRGYLNELKQFIQCIGYPDSKNAASSKSEYQCSQSCYCSWHQSGYPCGYNDAVLNVVLQMLTYDIRNLWKGNTERGQILDYLMSECRLPKQSSHYKRPYMYNEAPEAYATVLAYYGRCLQGQLKYCPDPCRNPRACSKSNMLSACYPIVPPNQNKENKYQILIDEPFSIFKKVFSRVAYCVCASGFEYNLDTEECDHVVYKCQGGDECLNNGKCSGVPPHIDQIIGRSYNCQCDPAWQGLRCEEARDPCLDPENRASCGDFECRRSPTNALNGYVCVCSSGYILTTEQGKPSCRDVNECAISAPCLNGGECHNLQGSFECICSRSFTGSRCEIPPPEPYWMAWSPWTECSVTCSVGLQHRSRNCSLEGSCIGSRKDFKNCLGRHMDCALASLADVTVEELAGGAGWRAEEDNILDDAWYFREFQLLRLGLNNRYMAEDEFVSGWEEILNAYTHYIALAGAFQGILLLLLCKRIRVRVRQ